MRAEDSRRVLLYGTSILLGSIGARLQQSTRLEVTACEAPLADSRLLDELEPDIILFDSETTHAGALLPLLASHPTVLLIGVSPDVNRVELWSGRMLHEMSLQDLVEIIDGEGRGRAHPDGV